MRLRGRQLVSLWEHLRQVEDFRQPKGLRHPLPTVLGIVLAARVAGKLEVKQIVLFAQRLS